MPGLYLHVPFCEHKCIYCDFYSIAPRESGDQHVALIERFENSLFREIEMRGNDPVFQSRFDTVFFGGGTPSLLAPSNISHILRALSEKFPIDANVEVTLETNPGTVDAEKLHAFRDSGVNRLSIGVQSFHDDDLRFLSRIHSSEQASTCVRNAYEAGFENVSVDLIFSLPSQTLERWKINLERAVALQLPHLSCYSLIVEPNTPLSRMVKAGQVAPLSQEADAEMYEFTIGFLGDHGYEHYEVSNFSKPGFRSIHNGNYWNHGEYLSFGPSAHSFWGTKRWWNISNVTRYADLLERGILPLAGEESLTQTQMRDEAIFLGLRSGGIDVAGFRRRFKEDLFWKHKDMIDQLLASNLAVREGDHFRLTSRGYSLCDDICSSFLSNA